MAVYIIRPNADSKANWTEVPSGTAWSILNETVTEADTPDTSNNYCEAPTTATSDICRQDATTFTLRTGELVWSVEGYWYLRTAVGQSCTLQTIAATNVVAANTAYGWQKVAVVSAQNQAGVDGLQLQAQTASNATSSTTRLAAEFEKVWTQNRLSALGAG